jgi:cytidylate kinase
MPVVAFTQEMGSLSKDVAEVLARELGLATIRHEVVEHVASKMHVSRSLIKRLREGQAGTIERLTADREGMAIYSAEEVLEIAARGNVVLRGWGATCLLRPVPHVVSVRITRPFDKRVEWLLAELDSDDVESAAAEIRRSDHAHASRMHAQFGVSWGDPLLYDIVLNTERISIESCVQQIRTLMERPEFRETEASRVLLQNLLLQARVRAALKADERTRDVNVSIDSTAGRVALRGMVATAAELAAAAEVAAATPGVSGLDNQLRVMAGSRRFPSAFPLNKAS